MTKDLNGLVVGSWSTVESAEAYDRARPGYSRESIAFSVIALGLGRRSVVVDVGAGTGKLARQLLPWVGRVIAIEPLEAMRGVLQRSSPDITVLDGRAESLPLADGSADVVVAGQAWHWFESDRALCEATRVTRPNGGIALFWNEYAPDCDLTAGLARIRREYEGTSHSSPDAGNANRDWTAAFRASPAWAPIEVSSFDHAVSVSTELLVERALSSSVLAIQSDDEKGRIRSRILELLENDPETAGRAEVNVPYRTEVYWTRRA